MPRCIVCDLERKMEFINDICKYCFINVPYLADEAHKRNLEFKKEKEKQISVSYVDVSELNKKDVEKVINEYVPTTFDFLNEASKWTFIIYLILAAVCVVVSWFTNTLGN